MAAAPPLPSSSDGPGADDPGAGSPGPALPANRRPVDAATTAAANGRWWSREARAYLAEHGDFLGRDDFVWCPEGLREDDARLLGQVAGLDAVEIGCGAGQCTRWLALHGARATGVDLAEGMLAEARRLTAGRDLAPGSAAFVEADVLALPFAPASFDVACSAFGALPFVADAGAALAQVRRVLRPGGRWVFSVSHPVRWAFPDVPGPAGLTARFSYFDRTPYVETGADGRVDYVEHHHTLGDWVGAVARAGFALDRLVEPEWPRDLDRAWGGWSPLRGRYLPGTAIFCCTAR